jgi:hypothetical protein
MEHFCAPWRSDARSFAGDARAFAITRVAMIDVSESLVSSAFPRGQRISRRKFATMHAADALRTRHACARAQHLVLKRLSTRSICEIALIFRLLV